MVSENEAISRLAALSAALVPIFRGRFCDVLLPNRAIRTFNEDRALYELGDREQTFFFVRHGVVKVGTITDDGREIIYGIRKDGDVVGELCVVEPVRRDRAVVVERTQAIAIPFDEVVEVLAKHPTLLSEAYDQVNRLAVDDVMYRLVDVLKTLACKFGRPSGELVEIATYLTEEELAQMAVARRERVSTALNSLRRRGIAKYSARGHLLLDMRALQAHNEATR